MAPKTKAEFEELFQKNIRYSGRGLNTTMHLPCPFCAAPEWAVYRILDQMSVLKDALHCKACGRSARTIFEQSGGGTSFHMMQVAGDDPPPWSQFEREIHPPGLTGEQKRERNIGVGVALCKKCKGTGQIFDDEDEQNIPCGWCTQSSGRAS